MFDSDVSSRKKTYLKTIGLFCVYTSLKLTSDQREVFE